MRRDGRDIDKVAVMQEGADLVDVLLDLHQPLEGKHAFAIRGDGIGDAANSQVLDMRSLRAQRSDNLACRTLHLERLQVVRHCHQVHFRRELHRRMAPIAVGKYAQLARADETLQLLLGICHDGAAIPFPVGDAFGELRGFRRIRLQRRNNIDPIESRKLIEVNDVVLHRMGGHHHVANVLGIHRHIQFERILDGTHRSHCVDNGAHAADALQDRPRVARIAVQHNLLDAAPHLAGSPGSCNSAVLDFDVDA